MCPHHTETENCCSGSSIQTFCPRESPPPEGFRILNFRYLKIRTGSLLHLRRKSLRVWTNACPERSAGSVACILQMYAPLASLEPSNFTS